MRRSVLIFSVFVLLFAFCGLGYAEELTTVTTAVELSEALAVAESNGVDDTITLAEGIYETSGDVAFIYDATVYGEGNLTLTASGEVVLDGGGDGQVLSIESDYMTDITLVGLTVVSGDYAHAGAGVYVGIDAGNIVVSECSFQDNTATGYGAGLYIFIEEHGFIRVNSCDFTGNVALDDDGYTDNGGGGLYAYIEETGDIFVEDSVFTGNSCDSDGGAAYLHSYVGDVTVSRVTATGNSSTSYGGAFYLKQDYSGTTTVEDSNFTDNTSDLDGGAVYFYPEISNTFVCRGNTFTSNNAEGAGGALCDFSEYYCSTADLVDNIFRENAASDGGGAYLQFANGGVMTVQSNDFIDNSAVDSGGGLYARGGYYDDDSYYYGETTISIDDCLFEGNEAEGDYGGGLYAIIYTDGGNLLVRNSSFISNSSTNGYAGGAYLEGDYGNVYLSGNDFLDNVSQEDGGGLYSYVYYGNFYLGESTFDGNVVSGDYDGGGAYLDCEYGDVTVERSAFTNNSCEEYGGGLYLYQEYGDLVFRDNLIANNTSEKDGGGAYLYPEEVRYADIVNNTITGNVISEDAYNGGGLYVECEEENTVYSISNNIVWGNEASGVSDDIFLYDDDYLNYFYVENNDFSVLSTDFTASSDLYEWGNLDEDPLFVSSTDFHLQVGSPIIDMGDSLAQSIGDVDIEGLVRVHGGAVDMGAYEYGSSLAGDGDEGDEGDDDDTGSSSGGCSTGSFAPALLFLVAPLSLLLRKR